MTIHDDAVDRLYELPLDEFTAERNELAKELRSRGDREAADEVRGLRKPSQAAWALNQVARRDPEAVARLLAAGEALREAQEGVVSGERDAAELREAVDEERAAVAPLVEAAGRTLRDRGRAPSEQLLERVRETLRAAAGDDEVAGRLRAGRLVEDHQAVGLGGLALAPGAAPPPRRRKGGAAPKAAPKPKGKPRAEPSTPSPADRRLRQRITEAKRRLRSAEKDADRARRELAAAEHDRERAELAFRSADRAFEEARGRAEGAAAEAERLRSEIEGLES